MVANRDGTINDVGDIKEEEEANTKTKTVTMMMMLSLLVVLSLSRYLSRTGNLLVSIVMVMNLMVSVMMQLLDFFDSMEKDQDADANAELYQKLAKESNKLPTMYGGTVELLDQSSLDSDISSDNLFPVAKAAAAAAKKRKCGC